MQRQQMTLGKVLEQDKDFLEFLNQEALSEEFLALKHQARNEQHLTREILYQYISGYLDNKTTELVQDHIAFCTTCMDAVTQLRRIEKEFVQFIFRIPETVRSQPPSLKAEKSIDYGDREFSDRSLRYN